MTKEQFLAMSLPHGLKVEYITDRIQFYSPIKYEAEFECGRHVPINSIPILHPLSDLTKEIEHKGERLVPLERLCDSYGAKFDRPYINERSAGFVYGFSAKDVLNVKNMIENKFWQIQQLIEWHFDIFGGIDNGDAIDVNSLSENPYK